MKRGPNAWINAIVRAFVGCTALGGNPLLVHAVQDDTNERTYLPSVGKWLDWCAAKGVVVDTLPQRDLALADFFAEMCYKLLKHPSVGKATLAGYVHLYPDHRSGLPFARRSLRSWRKLFGQLEREPLPELLWLVVVAECIADGDFGEAVAYAIHFDGVLRGQDIDQLREPDLAWVGGACTATLGDPSRGESVKTGVDQGAEFRRPWVNRILRNYMRGRKGLKVFPFDMEQCRKGFGRRLRRSGVPNVKGPHISRHSAAADIVAKADRGDAGVLERVGRAGRWADVRSCQVYAKAHLLQRMLSRLDDEVVRRGAFLLQNAELLADVWEEEFEAAGRPAGSSTLTSESARISRLRPPRSFEIPDQFKKDNLDVFALVSALRLI